MYISLSGLFCLLILYAFLTVRDERNAENRQRMREAEDVARARANSPYRVTCPTCGAANGAPCTAVDGVPPWQPHPERLAVLRALRSTESQDFYASLSRPTKTQAK